MNSRERISLALNHKEPDRIPIDFGGTLVTSLTKKAYLDLKHYLGMPVPEDLRLLDFVQQLPELDEDVMRRFGADFRMVQLPTLTYLGVNITEEGEYFTFTNHWGAHLRMPKDGGLYYDYVDFPIREPVSAALEQYSWPDPNPPGYVEHLRRRAEDLYTNTECGLVGGVIIGGGVFEQPARLMGMENFLMALAADPAFADAIMEKVTELYIEACDRYLEQIGPYIQVFTLWDDVCGQDGWLIRPETYKRWIKPKHRRLVEAVKKKTDAKVFFHSCGDVTGLIPHLIEIGVDILNPVQVSAPAMDTRRLKQEYGRDIVFWGGGVDTQQVLPFGTPEEVADEVRRRIDDLAPGGGFVFAAVHNIQPFVPPQNIVAAFDTAHAYGRY